MKNYTMFNYDYLFGDHFANVSDQAKLLYIKMNFYAVNGFVSNPLGLLDSLGFTRDALNELVANGDVLKLPDRSELFVTAFFVHNKGVTPSCWTHTNFYPYWKGKLWIKENRIATLSPKKNKEEDVFFNKPTTDDEWDSVMSEFADLKRKAIKRKENEK